MSTTSSPQRYTLRATDFKGWITLSDGTRVWVEYVPVLVAAVTNLPELKKAIEDVAARAAQSEWCDWVRICSLFHPTTIKDDGKRVMDKWGHHAVMEMRSTTTGGKAEKAHVYVNGFQQFKTLPPPGTPYIMPTNWYDQVSLKRVRWESQRTGSSVGSSGGNTPASTTSTGGASSTSQHSASSTQQASSRWVPCGHGEERYYSGSQGKYTNKYRKRNRSGGWDVFTRS